MSADDEFEIVQRHIAQLGEHFEAVQIFVSRYDTEAGTTYLNYGAGNWCARYGQVSEWLTKTNERTKEAIRREDG